MTNQEEMNIMTTLGHEQMGKLRDDVDPEWRGRVVIIVGFGVAPNGRPYVQVNGMDANKNFTVVKKKPILPSMFDPNFI